MTPATPGVWEVAARLARRSWCLGFCGGGVKGTCTRHTLGATAAAAHSHAPAPLCLHGHSVHTANGISVKHVRLAFSAAAGPPGGKAPPQKGSHSGREERLASPADRPPCDVCQQVCGWPPHARAWPPCSAGQWLCVLWPRKRLGPGGHKTGPGPRVADTASHPRRGHSSTAARSGRTCARAATRACTPPLTWPLPMHASTSPSSQSPCSPSPTSPSPAGQPPCVPARRRRRLQRLPPRWRRSSGH